MRPSALARISVSDDGVGIDPDDREAVFRPFYRGQGSERSEGGGLGLALCRRVVDLHGGEIWVDDTDRGTRIVFTLAKTDD